LQNTALCGGPIYRSSHYFRPLGFASTTALCPRSATPELLQLLNSFNSPVTHMSSETVIATFYVFILAAFLGYQVISRVPPLLHTPLMSATNAISGISLVGSLVTAGAHQTTVSAILGFIAVVCSTTNVVGGFVITDRMLKMFKRKATPGAKKHKV
jgi:NAD(P) transhydrogenase subunit alpha